LFVISTSSFSQPIFQKLYGAGGTNNFVLGSITNLYENRLLISGNLKSDILIFTVDSLGQQIINLTFGDSLYNEVPISSKLTIEGDLLLVGYRDQTGIASQDILISKFDTSGSIAWTIILGDTLGDSGSDFTQLSDSSFLVLGGTNKFSFNYDRSQSFLSKIDKDGTLIWTKLYGINCDSCQTVLTKMLSLSDSTFLLYGSTSQFSNAFEKKKLIIKIDINGNIVWSKLYLDNCENSQINKIIKNQNNNLVLIGSTCNIDTDIFMMEMDSMGIPLWGKYYYGALGSSDNAYDILEIENGNYLICGNASLTKTDSLGNLIWSSSYLLSPFSNFTKQLFFNNNRYLAGGTVLLNGVNNIYLYNTDTSGVACLFNNFSYSSSQLVITDSLVNMSAFQMNFPFQSNENYQIIPTFIPDSVFCQSSVGLNQDNVFKESFDLYPNPCFEKINLTFKHGIKLLTTDDIRLTDLLGRVMNPYIYINDQSSIQLDISNLKPGIYLIEFQYGGVTNVKKFIKI